jgi:hypothetical protein
MARCELPPVGAGAISLRPPRAAFIEERSDAADFAEG